MPKTKRDILKRKIAQAIQHQADTILAINVVYEEIKDQHPETGEILKTAMLAENALRDALIKFSVDAWRLDEDAIKSYL
jgi:hypothetical protein